MDDFKYTGHKDLSFWVVKGTVIESAENSQTHISGGGSYVNLAGGTNVAAVRSKVVNTQSIWIKKPDGTEKKIKLGGEGIDVRAGHEFSMIYSSLADESDGYKAVAVNNTTGDYKIINNAGDLNKLIKPFETQKEIGLWVIVTSILYFLVGGIFAWFGDLFGLIETSEGLSMGDPGYAESYIVPSVIFILYRVVRNGYLQTVYQTKLNKHLHDLAKSTLNTN